MEANRDMPVETQIIDKMSRLLDSRFRIPGTRITFGVDAIIGLIPGFGDIVSFAISGALVVGMVRHGASALLILKMIGNILLDTIAGAIPFLGDVFDVWYKSNRRNYILFKNYHAGNSNPGSIWPSLLIVAIILLTLLLLLLYMVFIWIPSKLWNLPLQ